MKHIAYNTIFVLMFIVGCSAHTQNQPSIATSQESNEDVQTALESVVGAIAGEEVSAKDLKELTHQIRKDKEAQSAIEAITGTMAGGGVSVKYCPKTGKRYSSKVEVCPYHGVKLKNVDE